MRFQQALKIRNPKNRLKRIYDACKGKKTCNSTGDESGAPEEEDIIELAKKKKEGCGAQQPNITIDGMKIIAEYKISKKKNDNNQEQIHLESTEKKQVLTAEKVIIRSFFLV